MKRGLALLLPPILMLALAVLAWELEARHVHRSYLVPHPSEVWQVFWPADTDGVEVRRALLHGLWGTVRGALAGLGLSIATGTTLALAMATNRWVRRAVLPYAVVFQTVPIIAIAPLLVIWLGYGLPVVVATSFIASVFPVIANTLAGFMAVEPAHAELFRVLRAGFLARTLKLRLPSALPAILTGWRIAGGLAVIGAIAGEFVAVGGGDSLGSVIDVAAHSNHTEVVLAAVLLTCVFGVGLVGVIGGLGRVLVRGK